jgi:hypothetical protein
MSISFVDRGCCLTWMSEHISQVQLPPKHDGIVLRYLERTLWFMFPSILSFFLVTGFRTWTEPEIYVYTCKEREYIHRFYLKWWPGLQKRDNPFLSTVQNNKNGKCNAGRPTIQILMGDYAYLNKGLRNYSNYWRKPYNKQMAKTVGEVILQKWRTGSHYLHGDFQWRYAITIHNNCKLWTIFIN